MKDTIKAHLSSYEVVERTNGLIRLSRNASEDVLRFYDSYELWLFMDELAKIIPRPKEVSTENVYVGIRGKYDI
jgi:hypothetical protein